MTRHFWISWPALVLAAVALGTSWLVWGAAYNFTFNNLEQGSHSTANPTITVLPEGATATGGDKATMLHGLSKDGPLPASAAIPDPASKAQLTAELPTQQLEPETRATPQNWEILLAAAGFLQGGLRENSLKAANVATGGLLGLTFRPVEGVGLRLLGGMGRFSNTPIGRGFAGAELELMPLHLSLGRLENLIELGVLGGATTAASQQSSSGTIYVGARVSLNLGQHWGVVADSRLGLEPSHSLLADAGLAIRL